MPTSRRIPGTPPVGRLIAALTLTLAVLLPALSSAPAVRAQDPAPAARVLLRIVKIHVFDNGAYVGSGDPMYTFTLQRTQPGCGTDPNDPHPVCHEESVGGTMHPQDVNSGDTVSYAGAAQWLPALSGGVTVTLSSGPVFVPPNPGLALYPGDSLLITAHGTEHQAIIPNSDLGSFQVSYDQAQNWGIGDVVHTTSSTNASDVVGPSDTLPGFQVDYEIAPAPLPDLIISDLHLDHHVGSGGANGLSTICATVANTGQEPAKPYTLRIHVDGTLPSNGVVTETEVLDLVRGPGPLGRRQRCVQFPLTPGQHAFLATVDEDQVVPEMNELNNTSDLIINVARSATGGSVQPVPVGGVSSGPAPTATPTPVLPPIGAHPIIAGTTTPGVAPTVPATAPSATAVPTTAPTAPPSATSVPTAPPTPTATPTSVPPTPPVIG